MLSVVIPTLNAAAGLHDCLASLNGADEIIVVDGGSLDDSRKIATPYDACLISSPVGRGVQLAARAQAASGDWLLFLHADTVLGPGWRETIAAHIAAHPDDVTACFRFRLDDPAWQARIIEAGVALRVRCLGLPYGDQGLLVSRAMYDRLGGYGPLPLMEDVDFVRRIGRRNLRLLKADAMTSAARWRADGWWRRSARNLLCLLLYILGVSPERIARIYA